MIANIALGLLGLGIVVFVHELGHFIAARLVGIDVEAFSIGWGKAIVKKKIRGVEYRLGMFPLGGYCKMRGHDEVKGAIETGAGEIESSKGTYYGASPLRRIAVCLAGPVFNFAFAVLVFSVMAGVGADVQVWDSRVVVNPGASAPAAQEASLMTGDRIVSVGGEPVSYFHELHGNFAPDASGFLPVTVERQGALVQLYVNVEQGGIPDVSPWIDTLIAGVFPDSDAAVAGLLPGDRIIRMNGREMLNSVDVRLFLDERPAHINIAFIRDGAEDSVNLLASQPGGRLGIVWHVAHDRAPGLSPPAALVAGARETWGTITGYVQGLVRLFGEERISDSVAGPARITYMVGDFTTASFEHGAAVGAPMGERIAAGARSMAFILAIISIAVGVMNLLPLPVLDGGQIILFTVELIRGKPTPPKALQVFQTVGVAIVFALLVFVLFNDFRFLGARFIGGG